MDRKAAVVLILLVSTALPPVSAEDDWDVSTCAWASVGAVVGAGAVIFGGPAALAALGFGAAGITEGSLAAGAMSVAATTGVGAGAVATAQSIGAAGLSAAGTLLGVVVGGTAGHMVGSKACDKGSRETCHR